MKMSINSGCFPSMISLSFNYDPKLIFSQISSKLPDNWKMLSTNTVWVSDQP